MMRRSCNILLVAVALLAQPSHGLVDPAPSPLPAQPWLVQIFVQSGTELREFCKGALIRSQWILTSGYCLRDPFEVLDESSVAGVEYVARFFGSSQLHEIEKFEQSPDFAVGLMKLKTPVATQPVTLSTRSASELLNVGVFILGTQITSAIRDINFNPNYGQRMYCKVDGTPYVKDGAACYVLARSLASTVQQEARAVVIDPRAPGAPNGWVDTVQPFDTGGSRLYLDFRADASYPCHEDLGAPVLRMNDAGGVELAGVVSGVGMAMGMSICGPGLGNLFATASWYQEYIDTTIAQDAFDTICPASPELTVAYPGGNKVRVSWTTVPGATGYRLFYTNLVGYNPFVTLDVGNRTEVNTEISPDFIYNVAIVAYNGTCTSPVSAELTVAL